ncbi:MAG: putative FmdB family regulatory protein [Motiliproteus sp.]|jgi:putative FmdB family regulatory protein
MPIYEYQCGECDHRLEALQKMSEQPLQVCPACTKPALNKLISAAGFRLSGSGWYQTDSKAAAKKSGSGEGVSANSKTATPAVAATTSSPTVKKDATATKAAASS